MFKFILQIIIMFSLGAIAYILARAMPRVNDLEAPPPSALKTHWFMGYLEKADEWLLTFLEKLLRRFRVFILRLDNNLTKKLHRFKKDAAKENVFASEQVKENGNGNGNGNSEGASSILEK
ncbi:MAG: hypothetical protein QMD50_01565 [Patescibacteria group bacterium]|nr:hypothetical protein [Patescibacteria group bacterium]